jgi:hypothetical protein
MTAPAVSAAARSGSIIKCAYRAVVVGLEWPSNAPINGSDAPPDTKIDANECLKSRWTPIVRQPEPFSKV